MQKEYDVFISYSRKDYIDGSNNIIKGNVISRIADTFDANGISYWIDKKGISSGDAFAKVIVHNIKASKLFVFVSSENSNKSDWTSSEIAVANQYKKKIIPFRIDDSTYNDDVILYVARLDHIDYFDDQVAALKKLVISIKKYIMDIEEDRKSRELAHKAEMERKRQQARDEISRLDNELESTVSEQVEWENKKNEVAAELKEISSRIKLLGDKKTELQARRDMLKKQLGLDSAEDSAHDTMPGTEDAPVPDPEKIARDEYEIIDGLTTADDNVTRDRKVSGNFFSRLFTTRNIFIFAALLFVVLGAFLVLRFCGGRGTVEDVEQVAAVDSTANSVDTTSLVFASQDQNEVYGIEVSLNMNWDSLYVKMDDGNKLFKVSFVLIKASAGMNDIIPEYKRFRKHAIDAGMMVASYHSLNANPKWISATGSKQAENYFNYVGHLGDSDMPPVLSAIPDAEHFDKQTFLTRSRDWVNSVHNHYNVTPIIFTTSSAYRDYFKDSKIAALYWISGQDDNSSDGIFHKNHDKEVYLFNGGKPQENGPKKGILSMFTGGTYDEFKLFVKNKH